MKMPNSTVGFVRSKLIRLNSASSQCHSLLADEPSQCVLYRWGTAFSHSASLDRKHVFHSVSARRRETRAFAILNVPMIDTELGEGEVGKQVNRCVYHKAAHESLIVFGWGR